MLRKKNLIISQVKIEKFQEIEKIEIISYVKIESDSSLHPTCLQQAGKSGFRSECVISLTN